MDISDFIAPERVLCNVEARSKKHSLDIVSELLSGADPSLSHGAVFDCMICREKLGCTALEGGIALPHGCAGEIDRAYGAFVKLSKPVDYDTPDNSPVDMIFGLVVPAGRKDDYCDELSAIAAALRDPELLRMLRAAKSSRGLYDMLTQYRPGRPASA